MKNLVYLNPEGDPITDSKLLAKEFHKRHWDVLRAIRNAECSTEFKQRNFAFSFGIKELQNGGTKKEGFCIMTFPGFIFVVMGFTGKEAAQVKEMFINSYIKLQKENKLLKEQVITQLRNRLSNQDEFIKEAMTERYKTLAE